jgi:phosphoglycolate phosphatase
MKLQAVLFDLDGTLLDTLDDLADSMNAVLEAHDMPTHPVESYKTFVGDGVARLVQRALPGEESDAVAMGHYVEAMREQYGQRWNAKTQPYDGIVELLSQLSDRKISMSVLSNKPDDFTKKCVEHYFPDNPFDLVVGVTDEIPPKPDPAGAKAIANTLGYRPDEFLYLGDTNTDMRTARVAGMLAVGAMWGFRTVEELEEFGAQALAEHPLDILELL